MDPLSRAAHSGRFGDPHAFERFVRASYADVCRLCAALVDAAAAEDLAQETFVRATRGAPRFRGEASARTWIFTIARRVCMDELRGRYRRSGRDRHLADAAASSAAAAGAATLPDPAGEIELHDLIEQLDADRRAAFVLTQMFRLTYDEAAAVCECPPGTIRSRVARARADLVTLIEQSDMPRRARPLSDPGR